VVYVVHFQMEVENPQDEETMWSYQVLYW